MKKLKIDYLQKFITNRIQENINLDYKESKALVDSNANEISKDISIEKKQTLSHTIQIEQPIHSAIDLNKQELLTVIKECYKK